MITPQLAADVAAAEDARMQIPETRYAKSEEVHIAYQIVGQGPIDLVYVPGWVSNVELNWEEPRYARFLQGLASLARLIVFDKRGTGLSDRVAEDRLPDLETRMDDVRAVMDAAGSERAVLLGHSEGGPLGVVFAASYPGRTFGLILVAPDVRAAWAPDCPWGATIEEFHEEQARIDRGWGTGEFERGFLEGIAPSVADDNGYVEWTARYFRRSASPSAALAINRMWYEIDITTVASAVAVPTLILNWSGAAINPPEESRYLAERIPSAEYVELPGRDHLPWIADQKDFLAQVQRFLVSVQSEEAELNRVLATVLFTDIVGSTERASKVGDRKWRELLETHHALVRAQLARFRGREVDTAGDGFLATFDGPARAIRCAQSIRERVRDLAIEIRAGLHAGECELIGDKIGGVAVHIGARVAALAGPGEVLVSQTVKDLVAGSGLEFEDRGVHELKGVSGEWRLYSVMSG